MRQSLDILEPNEGISGKWCSFSRTNDKFLLCVRNRIAHRNKVKGQGKYYSIFSNTGLRIIRLGIPNLTLTGWVQGSKRTTPLVLFVIEEFFHSVDIYLFIFKILLYYKEFCFCFSFLDTWVKEYTLGFPVLSPISEVHFPKALIWHIYF